MDIRSSDGEAFHVFRTVLEAELAKLRSETDPDVLSKKLDSAMHELSVVKTALIDQKIRGLKSAALSELVVAGGGLAATVVTSGYSIAATLLALASGFRSYSKFRATCRDNPAYFLWKAKSSK